MSMAGSHTVDVHVGISRSASTCVRLVPHPSPRLIRFKDDVPRELASTHLDVCACNRSMIVSCRCSANAAIDAA